MKQFKLKTKYPGLPDDWDNGMIIGHGERGSASYYSPVNSKYTDKHIPFIQCKNYPIHWEEIKENRVIRDTLTGVFYRQEGDYWRCVGNFIQDKPIDTIKYTITEEEIGKKSIRFKEVETKPLLFVTEDRVEIYEGDEYFRVFIKDMVLYENRTYASSGYNYSMMSKQAKHFSTKEAALDYIILNKPCLSINEIAYRLRKSFVNNEFMEILKDYVKNKL